ncbi:chromosome partitioning protein, ParB family [Clostridium cavendishii DSM 21758]|uniref:Chromosome partitioning protein, ParB family n=1 Tax=Clostridium cavendishii DSM 21758 TaxID=1121302 RepID=A0A1M6TKF9_9CLOT|nr:ParB/RepB/Spo0J family partition protein [Clostridium cavendishii]SHK57393.1 chromosome partitioning protein, ParB family [Clostridium cavendishii DSM 21758]
MSKKFGLGKGLGALIPEDDSIETKEAKNTNTISMNKIKPNKEQPRIYFDNEKIVELSTSIKEHGLIQPLILKKDEDCYSIIAGERRWRAAKMAGLKEVPAIIMDLDEEKLLEVSLIENIQREDLNAIEEGKAYQRLLNDFKLTQEELSKKIGKSRTAISNTMRLLQLDNRVQNYIIESVLSEGHGRALLGLEDKENQYKTAQLVIDENLSVRETEKIVKKINEEENENNKSNEEKKINPYYKDLQNRLQNYFGTKVKLNNKNNKGKIEIEYYSEEDLQRIIEIINL